MAIRFTKKEGRDDVLVLSDPPRGILAITPHGLLVGTQMLWLKRRRNYVLQVFRLTGASYHPLERVQLLTSIPLIIHLICSILTSI